MKEFSRECPKCHCKQTYTRQYGFNRAVKENRVCLSCSMTGRVLSEGAKKKLSAKRVGTNNPMFNRDVSQETRAKISNAGKGRRFSDTHKLRISESLTGKPLSENHKHKIRLATIEDLKGKGIVGPSKNHNQNACKFIDYVNDVYGLNLQHAQNGGEIELYGYFVDGYDKDRNIIFEYDEPNHKRPYKHRRDMIRQKNLLREITPTLFIRYDEKDHRIYDAVTDQDLPLVI